MSDDKTKRQLTEELAGLRERVAGPNVVNKRGESS